MDCIERLLRVLSHQKADRTPVRRPRDRALHHRLCVDRNGEGAIRGLVSKSYGCLNDHPESELYPTFRIRAAAVSPAAQPAKRQ
jgi:hypothetical protein